jgi:hypothetical protein
MSEAESRAEPEGDFRPWDQPGAVRRDVAPHRAEFLRLLATVSLCFSVAGVLVAVPAVIGVPLAVAACRMADRDLDRIGAGQLDPRGRAETHAAFVRAEIAAGLGMLAPFLCFLLWWGGVLVLREFF